MSHLPLAKTSHKSKPSVNGAERFSSYQRQTVGMVTLLNACYSYLKFYFHIYTFENSVDQFVFFRPFSARLLLLLILFYSQGRNIVLEGWIWHSNMSVGQNWWSWSYSVCLGSVEYFHILRSEWPTSFCKVASITAEAALPCEAP